MAVVKTEIDFQALEDWHRRAVNVFKVGMSRALSKSVKQGRRLAEELTPIGGTGFLRASITATTPEEGPVNYKGTVAWQAPYAGTVARGAGPRKVSLARLEVWSAVVLADKGAASAVQGAIERNGTPSPRHPNPGLEMDTRLERQWEPIVCEIFEQACDTMVRVLNGV